MRDVLTAHDHPPPDPALPDHVVQNEHAGHHPGTRIREIEADRVPSADRLLQRHAHRRLELHAETPDVPRDARDDQHVKILRSTIRMRQRVLRRAQRQRVGILAVGGDVALADAREPLKVNPSVVPRARHQLIGAQPPLGHRGADRSEATREQSTARCTVGRLLPAPSSARGDYRLRGVLACSPQLDGAYRTANSGTVMSRLSTLPVEPLGNSS